MKSILLSLFLCATTHIFSQWYKVYEGTDICLKDIAFADSLHGFAVADDVFLYTDDGGEKWMQDPSKTGSFYVLDFVNKDSGYICCDPDGGGKILYTHDGGDSWVHNEVEDPVTLQDIEFVQNDETIGMYVTGSFTGTVRAVETCNLWGFSNIIGPGTPWDIEFPAADTGFLSGELLETSNSTVFKTTNGGVSWYTNENMLGPVYYLNFPSSDIGYGIGYESRVWKTIDGGETWFMLDYDFGGFDLFDSNLSLGRIYFYNTSIGYLEATAYEPHIYKTIDGGETWNLTNDNEVDFSGANGFVCTDSNTCFFIDCFAIYKTTNGGSVGVPISDIKEDQVIFNMYPNPASNTINIMDNSKLDIQQIITRNCLGEKVNITWDSQLQADIYMLPSGIYFTEIITDHNKGIQKWIKQ